MLAVTAGFVCVRCIALCIGEDCSGLASADAHSVYVLAKGGLAAIGQISVNDEVPQCAPNDDDGHVQQNQQLEVIGAALQTNDTPEECPDIEDSQWSHVQFNQLSNDRLVLTWASDIGLTLLVSAEQYKTGISALLTVLQL